MSLSPDERRARGKAARERVQRHSHGEWAPASDRLDPIALLEDQARTRLPDLVPIRYGRMLDSAFAFYRGAAVIMAADLAATPRTGLDTQLCGDAHVSNFGVFGTPERRLAFDLNDFDETWPGSFEWDVKRLAASVAIAGRELEQSEARRAEAVGKTVAAYRKAMHDFADQTNLEIWYAHIDADELLTEHRDELDGRQARRADADLAKARTRDSLHALDKLTEMVDGEPRFKADPPLIVPIADLAPGTDRDWLTTWLRTTLRDYRDSLPPDRRHLIDQYRLVDFARKVVGVGSVGTRTWIALLLGRDVHDPLVLQVKEAQESVLAPYGGRRIYDDEAQRVVAGQRLMQAASDAFLGWKRLDEGPDGRHLDFYVRQLHDWKGSADIDRMKPRGLAAYGEMCGWALARAHARAGDPIAIAAYLGSSDTFDTAMVAFAEAYADQNERDLAALEAAVDSGRLVAQRGL
jgi:hypothetical protein